MINNNSAATHTDDPRYTAIRRRRSESRSAMKSTRPAIPYLGWMLVFTIVPLVMVVYYAFTDKEGNFSIEPFKNAAVYSEVFLYSLLIALISTLICLVLAYPLAFSISRCSQRAQSTIVMLLMVPMWRATSTPAAISSVGSRYPLSPDSLPATREIKVK